MTQVFDFCRYADAPRGTRPRQWKAASLIAAALCLASCSERDEVTPELQDEMPPEFQAEIDRLGRLETSIRASELPSEEQVDQLERQLAAVSCIGNIGRWERTYFFGTNKAMDAVDQGTINFRLREAGKHGFESGRRIVRVDSLEAMPEIDDRDYLVVY